MEIVKNKYKIYDERDRVDLILVSKWLSTSYWAKERTIEKIQQSINNSVCYSIYDQKQQIGFARMVSDFATFGYLADVYIDEKFRGQGIGKMLLDSIACDVRWKNLLIMLSTEDAHGVYKKYGFSCNDSLMSTRNLK